MRHAKLINGVANVFLIIGIILVPAGHVPRAARPLCLTMHCRFGKMGQACGSHDNSCGLVCSGTASWNYFATCTPWSLGTAIYLLIIGTVLLFVSTFVGSCVRYYPGACMRRVLPRLTPLQRSNLLLRLQMFGWHLQCTHTHPSGAAPDVASAAPGCPAHAQSVGAAQPRPCSGTPCCVMTSSQRGTWRACMHTWPQLPAPPAA